MYASSPFSNGSLMFHSLNLIFENITVQNSNARPMTGHS